MQKALAVAIAVVLLAGCSESGRVPFWKERLPPAETIAGECGGICTGRVWLYFDDAHLDDVSWGSCQVLKLSFHRGNGVIVAEEYSFQDSPWAKANPAEMEVPCDHVGSFRAECYKRNEASGELDGPYFVGTLAQMESLADCEFEEALLWMVPPGVSVPTAVPAEGGPDLQVETQTTEARWGSVVEVLNTGEVLIAGGAEPAEECEDWAAPDCAATYSDSAEFYRPMTGDFKAHGGTAGHLLTEPRAFAASASLPDGRVAVFGGLRAASEPTNTVDIFDPTAGTFSSGPPMDHTRAYHTATLVSADNGGLVLLVGGFGTGEKSWEIWSPGSGTKASGELAEARWNHTATPILKSVDASVPRNSVFIAGGEVANDVRNTAEIFDIDVQQLDPIPVPLCSNGLTPAARKTLLSAAYNPNRHFLFLAGGFKDVDHATPVKDICVWHTSQEKWSGEAGSFQLQAPRGAHTSAMPGGDALFIGGLCLVADTLAPCGESGVVFEHVNSKGETIVDISSVPDMAHLRWHHRTVQLNPWTWFSVGGLTGVPSDLEVATYGVLLQTL